MSSNKIMVPLHTIEGLQMSNAWWPGCIVEEALADHSGHAALHCSFLCLVKYRDSKPA